VALVLAVCVGVGWAVAVIVAATEDHPVGPRLATFLTTAGGALVGAVVGWLGADSVNKRHHRDQGPEGDE